MSHRAISSVYLTRPKTERTITTNTFGRGHLLATTTTKQRPILEYIWNQKHQKRKKTVEEKRIKQIIQNTHTQRIITIESYMNQDEQNIQLKPFYECVETRHIHTQKRVEQWM